MAITVNHHYEFKPSFSTHTCRHHRRQSHTDVGFQKAHMMAHFHRSSSTPCFSSVTHSEGMELIAGRTAEIQVLVAQSTKVVLAGFELVPASSGLGGAYYLRGCHGEIISILKPNHEFLTLKLFTNGSSGQPSLNRPVGIGETGVREVAAYLLDHAAFAGVPPTALIKISHDDVFRFVNRALQLPLIASLQQFVPHDFDAGDLGSSSFSVSSVHRIGILDIRLLNTDRHAGNILVKKDSGTGAISGTGVIELVPIDHGLCLPEPLGDPYFEWLHWPQALVPFSELEVEYIDRLDPLKDAELLRTELPMLKEASIRILMICTIFLKRAVGAGLCLADIGDMMTREFHGLEEGPSVLEMLCLQAKVNLDLTAKTEMEEEDDYSNQEEEEEVFQCEIEHDDIQVDEQLYKDTKMGPSRDVGDNFSAKSPGVLLQDHSPLDLPIKFSSLQSLDSYLCEVLPPLHERNNDEDENGDTGLVGLQKSASGSMLNHWDVYESRDLGAKCISFGDMSEEEWGLFLGFFGELLPEAFESRKNMKSVRLMKRFGVSCKF